MPLSAAKRDPRVSISDALRISGLPLCLMVGLAACASSSTPATSSVQSADLYECLDIRLTPHPGSLKLRFPNHLRVALEDKGVPHARTFRLIDPPEATVTSSKVWREVAPDSFELNFAGTFGLQVLLKKVGSVVSGKAFLWTDLAMDSVPHADARGSVVRCPT